MRTREEPQRLYAELPAVPRGRGTVDVLVVRTAPGKHLTPQRIEVTPEHGAMGDRWTKGWGWQRDVDRQLTLMMTPVAELVCDGQPLHMPGDNLLVSLDLSEAALPIGSRLLVGSALLEVTRKPHKGCKKFLARFGADALEWINDEPSKHLKLRGINCKILQAGAIAIGDMIAIDTS